MSRKTSRKKKQAVIKNDKQKKISGEKSRKEVNTWEVIGIALFVLSWVCIILPAVLSDSEGHLSYGWVFLVLFFILSISSVVVLIRIFPDAAALDMEKGVDKYLNRDFTKIADAGKQTMEERLKNMAFERRKRDFTGRKSFPLRKMRYATMWRLQMRNTQERPATISHRGWRESQRRQRLSVRSCSCTGRN